MAYVFGLFGLIASFVTICKFLTGIKSKKISDLHKEIRHYQNVSHLLEGHLLNVESLEAITLFCNRHLAYTRKDDVRERMQAYKTRAERLKKWYIFW